MARGRPPGYAKTGGRQKGTPNKINAYTRAQAWAYCSSRGYNPIKALVELSQATDVQTGVPICTPLEKIQIARELLRYLMVPLRAMEPDTGQIGEDITVVLEGEDAADLAEDAEISDYTGNGQALQNE